MQMGIRCLDVILLNVCDFRENWHRESCTFLNKLNYICACTVKPCDILEVKNDL